MSLDNGTGEATPAVISEVTTEAAQTNAATTDTATGAGEGGEQVQVTPKTYTEQEHRDAIERATAKAAAKAERRAFREATERLASQNAPQQQRQPANDGKPSRAQFGDDEGYIDALTEWKLEQRDKQAEQTRQQDQHRTMVKKTEEIYAKAEKLSGFDREAFDELPLTKPIVAALVESDAPEQLMHYMAANPAEVERIAALSTARQGVELGKLEVKLAELAKAPPPRSKAPPALGSTKGQSGASSMPDPSDTKAYIAWANAQDRAARH